MSIVPTLTYVRFPGADAGSSSDERQDAAEREHQQRMANDKRVLAGKQADLRLRGRHMAICDASASPAADVRYASGIALEMFAGIEAEEQVAAPCLNLPAGDDVAHVPSIAIMAVPDGDAGVMKEPPSRIGASATGPVKEGERERPRYSHDRSLADQHEPLHSSSMNYHVASRSMPTREDISRHDDDVPHASDAPVSDMAVSAEAVPTDIRHDIVLYRSEAAGDDDTPQRIPDHPEEHGLRDFLEAFHASDNNRFAASSWRDVHTVSAPPGITLPPRDDRAPITLQGTAAENAVPGSPDHAEWRSDRRLAPNDGKIPGIEAFLDGYQEVPLAARRDGTLRLLEHLPSPKAVTLPQDELPHFAGEPDAHRIIANRGESMPASDVSEEYAPAYRPTEMPAAIGNSHEADAMSPDVRGKSGEVPYVDAAHGDAERQGKERRKSRDDAAPVALRLKEEQRQMQPMPPVATMPPAQPRNGFSTAGKTAGAGGGIRRSALMSNAAAGLTSDEVIANAPESLPGADKKRRFKETLYREREQLRHEDIERQDLAYDIYAEHTGVVNRSKAELQADSLPKEVLRSI